MPFITKISTQKKNTERFNIFLDEKYAFSVDADVLVKFELKKGKELDDLDIIEIQYGDEVKKGFNRALEFLSYRMRSTKEVEDHLKKKEISAPVIAEVIHKLNDYKYLNDQEFAAAYVSTHKKTNGKGPDVLFRELRAKGIDDDTIKEALSSFSFEDQTREAVKHVEKLLKKDKNFQQKNSNSAPRCSYSARASHLMSSARHWSRLNMKMMKTQKKKRCAFTRKKRLENTATTAHMKAP